MALQYGTGTSYSVSMAGPFGNGGSSVKLVEITVPVANWKGGESPYSQVVEVDGVSVNSRVDLFPYMGQITECVAFMAENNGGEVTIHAVGDKPETDYVFQAAVTEVTA